MNTAAGLDKCVSFINCHFQSPGNSRPADTDAIKCVAISRQSGCGSHAFAEELAAWLQSHLPGSPAPWTIFDGSLMEAVLQDHHLPARLAAFLPEDRVSQLDDIIQQLLSQHPPTELLVRQTSETILRLAELGNVIVVGRGANIITARLPRVLHVRLIGSLEQRIARVKASDKLNEKAARARIAREDAGRRRYVKRYFDEDIDDPLHYHLVINTDWTTLREAAAMVGDLALQRNGPGAATQVKAAA